MAEDHVEVWDMVWDPEDSVAEQVADMELTMGSVTREYSDEIPAGHVMEQKPKAGRQVKKGTKMNVVISLGPKPEEPTDAGTQEETNGEE